MNNSPIRKLLYITVLSVAIYSCGNNSNKGTTYEVGKVRYITSFPKQIELSGKKIELAPESYGSGWIASIVDTTLILTDPSGTNGYFHAYSTNGNKYLSSFIKKGRGPGEFPRFPCLIKTELLDWICLADSYTGETVYQNLDSLIKFRHATANHKAASKVFDNGFSSLEYIDQSIRIVKQSCLSPENKLISSYRVLNDTILLREIKIFDFSNSENSDTEATTTSAVYSPVNKKLFCGLRHFNQINVYSLSGDTEFTLCVSKEKKLYSQQDYDKTSRMMRTFFYYTMTCSDKYLYALYYNCSAVELETDKNILPVIQVFSLDGKPIAELLVKEKLTDIRVDPIQNRLYGFISDNEELFYYDLNQ